MKKKRVLMIGINCLPELTGIGKYTGEMLQWMGTEGYEATMITSYPYYPQWKVQSPYKGLLYKKEILYDGKVTLYRCPLYIPSQPTGLKRLIHEASFFISAFFMAVRLLFSRKFDLIFCVAPPFHLGFLALFYRFFRGGEITYHIQDLQIDAARQLEILKPGWLFSMLFKMERFILNHVNIVSTISEGMKKKILAKTSQSVRLFPNWVDVASYHPVYERSHLKIKWGFSKEDKVILYSGSIGEKQGLDNLIHVARELKNEQHLKFVICGSGPFKEKLLKMASDHNLQNVHFLPLQDASVFNDFLNMADVHLILQKENASDLVMPSKLTTILAVGGLVLVTSNPGTTLYDVVTKHEIGIVIEPESETSLRRGILNCFNRDYSKERSNARQYAKTYLEQDKIMKEIFR